MAFDWREQNKTPQVPSSSGEAEGEVKSCGCYNVPSLASILIRMVCAATMKLTKREGIFMFSCPSSIYSSWVAHRGSNYQSLRGPLMKQSTLQEYEKQMKSFGIAAGSTARCQASANMFFYIKLYYIMSNILHCSRLCNMIYYILSYISRQTRTPRTPTWRPTRRRGRR